MGKHPPLTPPYQAFALPMHRDKQLSQPTPMRIIVVVCQNGDPAKRSPHWHTGIIHPAWTLRCEIFMCIFKVAKFDDLKITFRKRPLMLEIPANKGVVTLRVSAESPNIVHRCLDLPHPMGWLSQLQR